MRVPQLDYSSPVPYPAAQYHVNNAGLTEYFKKYILQKIISVFKFLNIPDNWDFYYFVYCLFCFGYVCVINTDKYGIIPQYCSLMGYNVFYRPTDVNISNPAFRQGATAKIGVNTELIYLQPNYSGIMDIVNYYADLFSVVSESIAVNLMVCKTTPIFEANTKSEAETIKKMVDNILNGSPCVVIDGNVTKFNDGNKINYFYPNTGNSYITDKLIQNMRSINNMLNTDIGVPNANTEKKERLITDEVNANNIETMSKSAVWYDTMKRSIYRVNKMFGLNIDVEWRWKNGSEFDNSRII